MIQPDDDQQANYQPTEHIEDVTTTDEDDESTPPDEDDLPPNEDGSDNTEDDWTPNNGFFSSLNCDFPSSFFDDIAYNLSKDGSSDLALLVGKWNCKEYAYTEDGLTFSDIETFNSQISRYCYFEIRDEVIVSLCSTKPGVWFFYGLGEAFVEYALSPSFNLINLRVYKMTMNMLSPEAYDFYYGTNGMVTNLDNACSYVIKGDELFIYFTGSERYNLLIFKRYKP